MAGIYDLTGKNIENTYQRVLQTPDGTTFYDGTGSLVTIGGGTGTPGLPNTSVQFNGNGAFSGSTNFTFNSASDSLTLSGSFNVTGSTLQIGNNTLAGNTTLSGSIIISGSSGPGSPTASVQIYGDIRQSGYHRFDPVTTNIDTSISASYIYVSGSTNDLYFSQNGSGYNNVTRLRWLEGGALYTGVLRGGILSSTPGTTTFNITSGSGLIVTMNASTGSEPFPISQYISWPNYTSQPITYSGSAKITYVGIDSSGQIIQQTVPWGSLDINQWDNSISLGVVLTLSGSVSTGVFNAPQISYGGFQKTDDFFRAFGPLKISGHTLRASGSSTLGLIQDAGTSYREGANYVNNANHPSTVVENSINTSKIYRYYISGSTPVIDTGVASAGYTDIDPTKRVDTTTGLLTSVSTNKYSLQRVFWFPNSPTQAFIVYYGNAQYDSLIDAVNAKDSEPFTEAPNTALNAIFLGYIAVAGGTTAGNGGLQNATNATIVQGGIFRSVGGVGSSGTNFVSTTLAGLADVSLSGNTPGDLLVYGNSSLWNNKKQLTGSYGLTGSLTTNGGISVQTLTASFVSASSGITGSLFGTSSWAVSASSTPNALITASVSSNVLTFTKGNGTTFNLTVNTGSGGGGGGTPGGSNTYIQFNSASAFNGSVNFTYNYQSQSLQQGNSVIASGQYSHAEGEGTQAIGFYSHAEGEGTQAIGLYSHAEGSSTQAIGLHSHAEGSSTQAIGSYSHAEGSSTQAIGLYSHAEGTSTVAGQYGYTTDAITSGIVYISSVYGDVTTEFSGYSYLYVNDGNSTTCYEIASATYTSQTEVTLLDTTVNTNGDVYIVGSPTPSRADRRSTTAQHAEGYATQTVGNYSHAEGNSTRAAGDYSHAEGTSTQAIGNYSHAEGDGAQAIGYGSHAEGGSTYAIGTCSHAEGLYTIASGSNQTVVGQYNKRGNTTDLFVVGGGSADADANRKDILNVSTTGVVISGSVNISGSLLVNGTTPGGSTVKAGSGSAASFGGTPRTGSITFTSAFTNNNYAVTVTGEDARSWSIQSKVSGSFVINSNSSVALTGPVYWIATPFGS